MKCWLVAFFSIEIPIMVFPLRGRFYTEITHCQISPRQPGSLFHVVFFSSRQSWKVENWVLKKLAIFHWTMILGERLHCWKLTDGILKIIHFPWNLEEFWCLAVRFRGCMVGYMLGSMTYDFPFLPTTFLRSLTIPSWWSYANVKNGNHVSNVRDKKYHTKLRHHHLENMATLEVDHRTVMLPFI